MGKLHPEVHGPQVLPEIVPAVQDDEIIAEVVNLKIGSAGWLSASVSRHFAERCLVRRDYTGANPTSMIYF